MEKGCGEEGMPISVLIGEIIQLSILEDMAQRSNEQNVVKKRRGDYWSTSW